jgi:hypothetical protein
MLFFYVALIVVSSIFSYTQVDLNLTLLNWQPYLSVQSTFTQFGYFNRPANVLVWSILAALLISTYFILIRKVDQDKYTIKKIKNTVLAIAAITVFSYTIFSHDIFNYIFDARIITQYGLNPYEQKALDFPQDDWTRFMQWTHRTYPYGPAWLAITVVPVFLGMGKFLPTYILFKLLFSAAYIASCIAIYKIAKIQNYKPQLAVALFAFHPLVIFDGLISPRIDMLMIAFGLFGVLSLLKGKKSSAFVFIAISAAIKYASALLLPFIFLKWDHKKTFFYLFIAAVLGSIAQCIYSKTIQPWYFLMPIAFLPFLTPYIGLKKVLILATLALFPMWIYLNFINTGTWLPVI